MFDPIESDSLLINRSSKESRLSSTSYIHIKEGRSYSGGKKKNYSSVLLLLYPNADLKVILKQIAKYLPICAELQQRW